MIVAVVGVLVVWLNSPLAVGILEGLGSAVLVAGLGAWCVVRGLLAAAGWWQSRRLNPETSADPGPGRAEGRGLRVGVRWAFAPVFLSLSVWLAVSGSARDLRWWWDEPLLRAEAERVLAATPPGGVVWSLRRIGTITVQETSVQNGRVHFLTTIDGFLDSLELVYTPAGAPPPPGGRSLGGGWTMDWRDMF